MVGKDSQCTGMAGIGAERRRQMANMGDQNAKAKRKKAKYVGIVRISEDVVCRKNSSPYVAIFGPRDLNPPCYSRYALRHQDTHLHSGSSAITIVARETFSPMRTEAVHQAV